MPNIFFVTYTLITCFVNSATLNLFEGFSESFILFLGRFLVNQKLYKKRIYSTVHQSSQISSTNRFKMNFTNIFLIISCCCVLKAITTPVPSTLNLSCSKLEIFFRVYRKAKFFHFFHQLKKTRIAKTRLVMIQN